MAISVDVYVEDPVGQVATYNEIVLLRDVSPTGGFSQQAGTIALDGVTPTYLYTITDVAGSAGNVYRYYFYNTTSGAQSPYSEIFYPKGTTLAALRIAAAREAAAGFDGSCSAAGTSTTMVDAVLMDTGINTDFQQGNWIYRPNATLPTDMMRRIAQGGFDPTTGTFTVSRQWTNAPANGEVYQVFGYYPPIDGSAIPMSWDRIVRRALREAWFVQQLNVGPGNPPIRRFSLAPYGEYFTQPDLRRVIRRYTDALGVIHDYDCDRNGRMWDVVEGGPGELSVDIWPAPLATEDVIIEVVRVDPNVYQDADVTLCPYEYAVQAIAWQLYYQLNSEEPGKYQGELGAAAMRFQRLQAKYRPAPSIKGV